MSYHLASFNGVTLPLAQMDVTVGTGNSVDVYARLMDGSAYDNYGSARAPVSFPVTEELRALVVATDSATLTTLMNQLTNQRGKRGLLYRTLDDASQHWCYARLNSIDARRDVTHRQHLPVALEFARETNWYGASYNIQYALDSSPVTAILPNYGTALATNVIITVEPIEVAITGLSISVSGISKFDYNGTIAINTALVIDCGAFTVTNNGADDYANFALTAEHTIPDWLRVESGAMTTARIDFVGGGETSLATFSYYETWE